MVKVLRMVDGDGPSLAFVYGEILQAKKQIKETLNNLDNNYKLIMDAIDVKMAGRLDSSLHLTAYLLNPHYSYNDKTILQDTNLMDALFECVETFYHDHDEMQAQVLNEDWHKFKDQEGVFRKPTAKLGYQKNNFNPGKLMLTIMISTQCILI